MSASSSVTGSTKSDASSTSASSSSRRLPLRSSVVVPTLTDLCLAHVSSHLEEPAVGHSLVALPEPLVQALLGMVLAEGRLTPRLVRSFRDSGHDSIVQWLKQNVQVDAALMHDLSHSCRPSRW